MKVSGVGNERNVTALDILTSFIGLQSLNAKNHHSNKTHWMMYHHPADGSWILLVEGLVVHRQSTTTGNHVIERHEGIVDGDRFHIGILRSSTEHDHSNTTVTLDAQLHRNKSFLDIPMLCKEHPTLCNQI